MATATDMIIALQRVVTSEGTSGVLGRARDPAGTPGVAVRYLLKHPGVREEAVINSYGIDAHVITMPITPALLARPPERFDYIDQADPGGGDPLRYVFDAVVQRQTGGTAIAFTAYVRGKGG